MLLNVTLRWGGLVELPLLVERPSMGIGAQDTVVIRHDMRNPTGGLYLAALQIVPPESAWCPTWKRCP